MVSRMIITYLQEFINMCFHIDSRRMAKTGYYTIRIRFYDSIASDQVRRVRVLKHSEFVNAVRDS